MDKKPFFKMKNVMNNWDIGDCYEVINVVGQGAYGFVA